MYELHDFTETLARTNVEREQIALVVYAGGTSPEGGGSWEGGFLVQLKRGPLLLLSGWCDYTGWGCQDGVSIQHIRLNYNADSFRQLLSETEWNIRLEPDEVDELPADLNRWVKGGTEV